MTQKVHLSASILCTTASFSQLTFSLLILTEFIPVIARADHTVVGVGIPVALRCNAIEANQRNYTYSWTHNGTLLSNETSPVVRILSFNSQDAGTYVCEMLSAVGRGRGIVILEEGGESLLQARGRETEGGGGEV